jgi:hypothetical protein
MKMKVFSVYDSKVEAYQQPFFMPTEGAAIRLMQQTLEEKNSMLSKFPADYTLHVIGEWDDQKSELVNLPENKCLGSALELRMNNEQ